MGWPVPYFKICPYFKTFYMIVKKNLYYCNSNPFFWVGLVQTTPLENFFNSFFAMIFCNEPMWLVWLANFEILNAQWNLIFMSPNHITVKAVTPGTCSPAHVLILSIKVTYDLLNLVFNLKFYQSIKTFTPRCLQRHCQFAGLNTSYVVFQQ